MSGEDYPNMDQFPICPEFSLDNFIRRNLWDMEKYLNSKTKDTESVLGDLGVLKKYLDTVKPERGETNKYVKQLSQIVDVLKITDENLTTTEGFNILKEIQPIIASYATPRIRRIISSFLMQFARAFKEVYENIYETEVKHLVELHKAPIEEFYTPRFHKNITIMTHKIYKSKMADWDDEVAIRYFLEKTKDPDAIYLRKPFGKLSLPQRRPKVQAMYVKHVVYRYRDFKTKLKETQFFEKMYMMDYQIKPDDHDIIDEAYKSYYLYRTCTVVEARKLKMADWLARGPDNINKSDTSLSSDDETMQLDTVK